jgi:hypothetical protein
MTNYTIVRIGNEYIVRADDKSILKTSSRRKAAKLVTDAVGLLDRKAAQRIDDAASISRDGGILPDASKVP